MYVGWKECEGNLKKRDREKKKKRVNYELLHCGFEVYHFGSLTFQNLH